MEAIQALIGVIVEGVSRLGIVPFILAFVTIGGFLGFDRLTKSSVAEKEREDSFAARLLDQSEKERERHYEEREQGYERLASLIKELIETLKIVNARVTDLDERLVLTMKIRGDKP